MSIAPCARSEGVLSQYFRCPDDLLSISAPLSLNGRDGFFRFGEKCLCYGRCEGQAAERPSGTIPDSMSQVTSSERGCRLTFDLDEVVDNLRLEKYQQHAPDRDVLPALSGFYYLARPLVPKRLRRLVQRLYLRDWSKIPFPRWPVDTTVDDLLRRCLGLAMKARAVDRLPFIWFWPKGHRACAIVTHDVETEAGLKQCETLMDLDDSNGIKASFQLVPEGRYEVSFRTLSAIKDRGFEVNVHDLNHDGLLYKNYDEFLKRARQINLYGHAFGAAGFRAGVLYRNPAWYDALDFSYDMSIPNVGHLEAQRGGCCTVMPFFIRHILELPLTTTQDYSLFYMLKTSSISLWKKQAASILNCNGLISFNSHPDYLFQDGNWESYVELLVYLARLQSTRRVWLTTPGEVNRWWRRRNCMRLVAGGTGYQIEGPGCDQAEIAYAVLRDDEVRFEYEAC